MRVIISGPVTEDDLADAEMLADIRPSSFVTNGTSTPPLSMLPVDVFPVCTMRGHGAEDARDYTLCHNADALVSRDGSRHLLMLAERYGLLVFDA